MKGVTTLFDKKRLADAANDSDLSDLEVDQPMIVQTHNTLAPAESLHDFALSLRSFDEYVAFLSPMRFAGKEAEGVCFASISPSFGFQLNTLDAIQLDLFQRNNNDRSVEIPMDQLCELCFREEEELASEALAYIHEIICQNASLGEWVWSFESILRSLQLFGCRDILVPCDQADIWSMMSCDIEQEEFPSIDVYSSNQAHKKMEILLKLIASSYERPFTRSCGIVEKKEGAAKLLVMLLRLSCDATIQTLCPQPMQAACRAVLAHCRSLEVAERRSSGTISFQADVAAIPDATNDHAFDLLDQPSSIPLFAGGAVGLGEVGLVSPEDAVSQEESQLSSQLHETTLSAPGSPTTKNHMDTREDSAVDAASESQTYNCEVTAAQREVQGDDEEQFLYTMEEIAALDSENMTVVLLRALLHMVRCRDVTLLTLAHAANVLNFSGESAYHGLWEYFVRATLQYRIAPYFPQVPHPTVAQQPSWADSSSTLMQSSNSDGESAHASSAVREEKEISTCAYMVQCIQELTAQSARSKHANARESLYGDAKALRGFFKLVLQYVLFYGEIIEAEDLEDLEEACTKFRKKTNFVGAEDVLDYIVTSCTMYLD